MMPTLHDVNERQFASLGLGSLSEANDCTVYWQANGMYELEMQYPVFGRRFAEMKLRRIILASVGPEEQTQPFRIYRMAKPLLGIVTIYARHIAYDLMGFTVTPFTAQNLAEGLWRLQEGAVTAAHGFTLDTDKTSSAVCTVTTPRSVWSMLGGQEGSLLDVYGGEWDFDRFTVTLRERLGSDNGVTIHYGKNLQTLEQDESIANTWTGVQPYWAGADGAVVVLPEAVIAAEGTFDYTRILVLDLSTEWQEAPTEEQLRDRAKKYMTDNDIGAPAVTLDVGFVPLDQTEEYKGKAYLNKIHKGDDVAVVFPTAVDKETGAPTAFVTAKARAVKTVWKPLLDRYENVYLGSIRANFAKVLAQTQKTAATSALRKLSTY